MPISTTWLGWFLCLRSHFWYHSSFSCGCCWCSWISLIISGRQSVALDFGYAFFVYHCRACPKRRDVLQSSTIFKNVFHLVIGRAKQNDKFKHSQTTQSKNEDEWKCEKSWASALFAASSASAGGLASWQQTKEISKRPPTNLIVILHYYRIRTST